LRAGQTPAELVLWEALRDRRLSGGKFRRQHPIGRYIADFYCAEAALVVELDGSMHACPDQEEYDQVRTAELEARGLRVVRISNEEAVSRFDEVLQRIADQLPLSTGVERGKGGEVSL
jgi:very-short-patch-repair endonuclease